MRLKLNANFMNELHMACFKAIQEGYVNPIVDNTPWDTGLTAAQWDFFPVSPFNYKLINTNGDVVLFLNNGTGIYGPKKKRIVPKNKKALRWYDRKTSTWAFAKSVKGIKPRKFVDAIIFDKTYKNKYHTRLKYHLEHIKK